MNRKMAVERSLLRHLELYKIHYLAVELFGKRKRNTHINLISIVLVFHSKLVKLSLFYYFSLLSMINVKFTLLKNTYATRLCFDRQATCDILKLRCSHDRYVCVITQLLLTLMFELWTPLPVCGNSVLGDNITVVWGDKLKQQQSFLMTLLVYYSHVSSIQ